jgi:hypothetical protein
MSPLSLWSKCKPSIQEASSKRLVYFSSAKKEASSSAETSVNTITWCRIQKRILMNLYVTCMRVLKWELLTRLTWFFILLTVNVAVTFLGGKGGRLIRLTSPPSVNCLENVGASTSYNPIGLHGQLQG